MEVKARSTGVIGRIFAATAVLQSAVSLTESVIRSDPSTMAKRHEPDDDDPAPAVTRHAEAFLARLPATGASFAENLQRVDTEFRQLLDAVRQLDPQFAFDLEGRPAAVQTIRAALPGLERELLDAVLDDYACEIRATQEALYRVLMIQRRPARAPARPSRPPTRRR
jgi:hypothetical protein